MSDFNKPKKSQFNDLAVKWILENLTPIKSDSNLETSYTLKHKFEYATGIYMTNGEFKYAMREAGFEPTYKTEPNWEYRISRKSPGLKGWLI